MSRCDHFRVLMLSPINTGAKCNCPLSKRQCTYLEMSGHSSAKSKCISRIENQLWKAISKMHLFTLNAKASGRITRRGCCMSLCEIITFRSSARWHNLKWNTTTDAQTLNHQHTEHIEIGQMYSRLPFLHEMKFTVMSPQANVSSSANCDLFHLRWFVFDEESC